MKKQGIILLVVCCLIIGLVLPCFATDEYFDDEWELSPTAQTAWGIRAFPHELRAHEAANYSGNNLIMIYHECNAFWYPKHYAEPELWYNVYVNAKYKSGSTTVGTVYNWQEMSWLLPVGMTESGGYNSTDFSLSMSQTCKGEYTSTVDCDALYWPLVRTRSITFN